MRSAEKRAMAFLALVLSQALSVAAVSANAGGHAAPPRHLRPAEKEKTESARSSLVMPLQFEQKLLVCNAYPSESPISMLMNSRAVLLDEKDAIRFRECRYLQHRHMQKQDRLDFTLRDVEVQGTFEIDDLPSTDAVLLLVLQKRPGSSMLSFTSFAFSPSTEKNGTQVAVIDAFAENASSVHLKVEDHVLQGKQKAGGAAVASRKRAEELNFGKVYSVEQGTFDTYLVDTQHLNANDEAKREEDTRRVVRLAGSSHFVLLRTGGGHYKESLTVFPEEPLPPVAPSEAHGLVSSLHTLLLSLVSVKLAFLP